MRQRAPDRGGFPYGSRMIGRDPRSVADDAHSQPNAQAWHAMSRDRLLGLVGSATGGLGRAEAARRLARDGPNELPAAPPVRLARVMLRQVRNPLVVVLGAAIVLSLLAGAHTDALFIAVVIAVNATIGGVQEWRAERSAASLSLLLRVRATVVRDGEPIEIDAREVVVGDVLLVESGFHVAADARLLTESGLEVDESLLTGESTPVAKDDEWIADCPDTALADRTNMLHSGTSVVHGRGRAVVVATGLQSGIGRLARDVAAAAAGKPPLVERLERFSRVIGIYSLAAAVLVVGIGCLLRGYGLAEMAVFGVALAVSVIPEGLPVAITIALAVATRRMAKRGVIVRRLDAVEGLGSCTLVASDKTGTLTCNELTVREVRLASGRIMRIGGEGFLPEGSVEPAPDELDAGERAELARITEVATLCNEASLHRTARGWTQRGDPTEVALLVLARKLGVSREEMLAKHPEIGRVAFEPERRFALATHAFDSVVRTLAKGAPEQIALMCADGGGPDLEAARAMAASGLRVLAIATKDTTPGGDGDCAADAPAAAPHESIGSIDGLRAVGLVGMIDPLRRGARDAVARCRELGVRTILVTGDHPGTALAIARELGLAERADEIMTGAVFDLLSDAELDRAHRDGTASVFARFNPTQKLRLVESARRTGQFVAVTGDGANDAPALKAANIGVAMGRGGTDAARDAADLVLVDDDFATIVAGVEEGRTAFANIRKVIFLLLSTNGAEAFMVIGSLLVGLPLPLLPTQLLWLNLATEGLQDVALAFEPASSNGAGTAAPPVRRSIFDRWMIERLVVGSLAMGAISFAAFWLMIARGVPEAEARNTLLLLMVLLENIQAGNARSEHRLLLGMKPWGNPLLLAAVLGSLALQVVAMHWGPLAGVLEIAPVPLATWFECALLALVLLAVMELHKVVRRPRR